MDYGVSGEPVDVILAGHNSKAKIPFYCYRSVPRAAPAAMRDAGGVTQMVATPIAEDLFPSTSSEPPTEQKLSAGQLLYSNIDKGTLPRNGRCREVFGFNLVQDHKLSRELLNVYAVIKKNDVHSDTIGYWRTTATLVKNTEKPIVGEGEKAKFTANVKPILIRLDQDTKGGVARWNKFECKLRSRMTIQSAGCFRCGSAEHLRECSRCRGIRYCSKECQAADWSVHKQACSKEEAERLSAQYEKAKKDGVAEKGRRKISTIVRSTPQEFDNIMSGLK